MEAATTNPIRQDAEIIGLVGIAHGTSHFFHLLLPPLFPWLMREFGLSFVQSGFLMTVFFVVSGVGQALAGFVVDRRGARPVLLFGIALFVVAGLLLRVADSYALLLTVAAVAGLGNSIFHPADFTLLNRSVSGPRLGHGFSVHGLAGNLGWAAAPVFMAGIAGLSNWRSAAFAAAGLAAGVWLLLWVRRASLAMPAVPHVKGQAGSLEGVLAQGPFAFLRSTPVWLCFFFFLFSTGSLGILQSYGPSVLNRLYGVGLDVATAGLVAYLIGSSIGTIAGGFAAARSENNDTVIAVVLAVAALLALVLANGAVPAWSIVPLMAAMGFGVGVATPNRDLLVRKSALARFGKVSFGRIYGFVYSGLDVGMAASPVIFGAVLDAGAFEAPLYGVAALQVAALLTALRVGVGIRPSSRVQGKA
jgi:MFS family permease